MPHVVDGYRVSYWLYLRDQVFPTPVKDPDDDKPSWGWEDFDNREE